MNPQGCLRMIVALFLTHCGAGAVAQPLYSLLAPDGNSAPGATIEIRLAVLNRSSGEFPWTPPATIAGTLLTSSGQRSVTLHLSDRGGGASTVIDPGHFGLSAYRLTLPPDVLPGDVMLEVRVTGAGRVRTALELSAGTPAALAEAPASERPTTNLARARPAAARLRRVFADRIAPHEPVYFVYGPDAPAAKFQFSFKYKLLDFRGLAPQHRARTLQFAFTQRSLWDINAASSPFYDTSYMPEFIYESLALASELNRRFTWLGFQAAYKHESNGRDGPLSRSLNVFYARPVFAFGPLESWHLLVIPEVFGYLSSDPGTVDIEDYRGYGRLHLVFGRPDGPSLMTTAWAGKDLRRFSFQCDFTVPVSTRWLNFETYLLLQYFNGYGESLLSYREQTKTVRAGFSLVR